MNYEKEKYWRYNRTADKLLALLLVCCSIGTGIQFGLDCLFGISMNLFLIELAILVLFAIRTKDFRVNRNIFVLLVTCVAYLVGILIGDSRYVNGFLKDFILQCSIMVLALCFRVNYDLFLQYAKIASVIILCLLNAMIITDNSGLNSYMSFGFHYMMALSFLFYYFYMKKNGTGIIICCVMIPQMLIYSSRSCWYMIGILLIIVLFGLVKNKWIKLIGTGGIVVVLLNFSSIALWVINSLIEWVGIKTYALRNLKVMLESNSAMGSLGDRRILFNMAIEVIEDHPFIGVGIGGFSSSKAIYPHNLFLDIWVTFGIFIGTALIFFLIYMVYHALADVHINAYHVIFIWVLTNFTRLLTTHTFICEPIFFMLLCLAINGLAERRRYDLSSDSNL